VSKLAILLLLAGFGPAAFAGTCVTVQQVEQLLSASHGLPDAKLAAKISDFELTERASSLRLLRWEKSFTGKRTREALLALADASAFLELPSSDIPAIEKPDAETRKQILDRMVEYVNITIHKLPNFSARRSTAHFDVLPPLPGMVADDTSANHYSFLNPPPSSGTYPLHITDRTAITVTYRNGQEVPSRRGYQDKEAGSYYAGLTTRGEFGPILSVVVGDAIKGRFFWDRWEQGLAGPLAVFRYKVPQEFSHYTVTVDEDQREIPAYHGELAIDPANGTILRISVVADLDPRQVSDSKAAAVSKASRPGRTLEAAIAVEYGSVTIGNISYICPAKGIALWRTIPKNNVFFFIDFGVLREVKIPLLTFVNDVSFTGYRLFRGDVRVLP
jgi:hypothetical protein